MCCGVSTDACCGEDHECEKCGEICVECYEEYGGCPSCEGDFITTQELLDFVCEEYNITDAKLKKINNKLYAIKEQAQKAKLEEFGKEIKEYCKEQVLLNKSVNEGSFEKYYENKYDCLTNAQSEYLDDYFEDIYPPIEKNQKNKILKKFVSKISATDDNEKYFKTRDKHRARFDKWCVKEEIFLNFTKEDFNDFYDNYFS